MKGKVLLVEDNHLNQKVFKIMFEDAGCEVDIASNGREALEKLQNHYQLVIMDIGLPDMSGIDVTRRFRAKEKLDNPDRPAVVFALTGHKLDSDERRCKEAGMNGYLIKPLMRAQMHQLLAEHLGAA